MSAGKVYLVGAGPGDPGLITRKALECLARADVIVYDHLLDRQLVETSRPDAEKIYVGKVGAQHTMEQNDINRLLVDRARQGKIIVRLKGGDPFIFGRGGEEAEALAAANIPFEVVPGISSAIAVPAYAGIPVTQRGLASSLALVTGHEDPTKADSSIKWDKLSTGVDTLIFLMGMENLGKIVAKLLENGRSPETPVAVIEEGTRPQQRTVTGNLKNIEERVKDRLNPPAIIVVGDVVEMREKLRWFDNRPLFGKRVLVTRARQQASALSQLLAERGAQPVELPAINIQPITDTQKLDTAILNLDTTYQWLVFTSVNGVTIFFDRLHALKRDARWLHGRKIGVIGPATARAIEQHGIFPDYCPETYTTEGIIAGLNKFDVSGQRFLLPRAEIADRELTDGLAKLGAEVEEIAVYHTIPEVESLNQAKQMLGAGEIDVVTFTSSSTVTNLISAFGNDKIVLKARVACIGPKTAATARSAGLHVDILADEQTIPGLVAAIEKYFREGV